MQLILGIIIGLLIALIIFVLQTRYQPVITREVKKINNVFSQKGKILEPDSEELEGWIKEIEKNENETA